MSKTKSHSFARKQTAAFLTLWQCITDFQMSGKDLCCGFTRVIQFVSLFVSLLPVITCSYVGYSKYN